MPAVRRNNTLTYFQSFANALQNCSSINGTLCVVLNWWHEFNVKMFPPWALGSCETRPSACNRALQHKHELAQSWSKLGSPARNVSAYHACREGIDPAARAVNHTFAALAQKQVLVYQKESFTTRSCYILFGNSELFCHIYRQAAAGFVFSIGHWDYEHDQSLSK